MEKCNKCGYRHYDFHRCLETFYFKHEFYGDDWEEIGASDHEDAAKRLGEMINEDEYKVNEDIFEDVPIANHDKSEIKKFNVYAEPEISYIVTENK